MKITLHLSDDQLYELKNALRDKASMYMSVSGKYGPEQWERANVIDDILFMIYEQEGED